jgi:hypothetical protein
MRSLYNVGDFVKRVSTSSYWSWHGVIVEKYSSEYYGTTYKVRQLFPSNTEIVVSDTYNMTIWFDTKGEQND